MIEDKLNSYIWKNKKTRTPEAVTQSEVKMMDMTERQLNSKYAHCKNMLYNENSINPGRYLVLKEISEQINNCGAELAVRWFCQLKNEKGFPKYSRFSLLTEIKNAILTYKTEDNKVLRLQDVYDGIPSEFNPVTLISISHACMDALGRFNKKHVTQKFILRQGIWFTAEELKEFPEFVKAVKIEDKISLIRERLELSADKEIRINSQGLSFSEFRAMIQLKFNKKYSELTTTQLSTLKNKILFLLELLIYKQIGHWQELMAQIEEVAEYKQFKLQ